MNTLIKLLKEKLIDMTKTCSRKWC